MSRARQISIQALTEIKMRCTNEVKILSARFNIKRGKKHFQGLLYKLHFIIRGTETSTLLSINPLKTTL